MYWSSFFYEHAALNYFIAFTVVYQVYKTVSDLVYHTGDILCVQNKNILP